MTVESFSYAQAGRPAGLEIDCRQIATSVDFAAADGRDIAVQERLLAADHDRVLAMIETAYRVAKGGDTVAFGCADGRYRSVAMAEMLGRMLRENGGAVVVRHVALE